jgi:hypothetical protein
LILVRYYISASALVLGYFATACSAPPKPLPATGCTCQAAASALLLCPGIAATIDCSFGRGATIQRSVDALSGDLGLQTLLTHRTRYDGLWVVVDGALAGGTLCPRGPTTQPVGCIQIQLTDLPAVSSKLFETACGGKHVHITGIFRDARTAPALIAKEIYWTSPEGDLIE